MIVLNPLAWLGLIVLIAPILIHILVQRRAEQFAFPTLRFIQPTRLAAIRRHVLEDLPLLIVRAGVLAAAVGALAGPLLLTPARRHAWNARTVRGIVTDGASTGMEAGAFRSQVFATPDLRDGVRRAIAWLETAPPARRELLISAPLAMGTIARADLAAVPPDVGIRFVRSGTQPAERSFAGAALLSADLQRAPRVEMLERTIDLNGASTSVRESAGVLSKMPVEIVASPQDMKAAEAALAAVLSQRVFAPLPGRTARVEFVGSAQLARLTPAAAPTEPWIASAIARIAGDDSLDAPNPDGAASIAATSDGPVLVVRTAEPPTSLVTVRLLRTVLNALAAPSPVAGDAPQVAPTEILPIPDLQLRAWERPAREVGTPRLDTLERDDRRWWWAAALLLLALETWMRRERGARSDGAGAAIEEAARVA
jgi:hypothetical protein